MASRIPALALDAAPVCRRWTSGWPFPRRRARQPCVPPAPGMMPRSTGLADLASAVATESGLRASRRRTRFHEWRRRAAASPGIACVRRIVRRLVTRHELIELRDVRAGNKGSARANQDNGTDFRILLRLVQRRSNSFGHASADGIHRRVVNRQDRHAILNLILNKVRHRISYECRSTRMHVAVPCA